MYGGGSRLTRRPFNNFGAKCAPDTIPSVHLLPGQTKNSEGRVVKMTDEVYDYLRICVEGKKPEDAVFTWEAGSQ